MFHFTVLLLTSFLVQTQSRVFIKNHEKPENNFKLAERSLIVNGFNAPVGRPFFASVLFRNWKTFCGATIIHPYWVITAAHCVSAPPG